MTVEGNVISCDDCVRQISMPMESKPTGKQSLDERVRGYAINHEGWRHTADGDICPGHGFKMRAEA
jgi:hypothetical protein